LRCICVPDGRYALARLASLHPCGQKGRKAAARTVV
jgi:hypothetical protein